MDREKGRGGSEIVDENEQQREGRGYQRFRASRRLGERRRVCKYVHMDAGKLSGCE